MASSKAGHIYIVDTTMTHPPKAKFALCVCIANGYFMWINTEPRPHGRDQLALPVGCHNVVRHDSYLDVSRVVIHPEYELDDARELEMISRALRDHIVAFIDAGLSNLPPRHANIARATLVALPV